MKYGSLFSGIGGFDIALNRAGFIPAWMCEIDKSCQNILKKHFEGVKIYDDVRTIRNAEPVDLICGGFPCQDLSVAGKRAGLAGERSGLWFEFARVIDELEPKWVVIENVPGLLSSNKGRDFAVIIQWLVKRGYGVSWRILDAQYFGVPQRRRRVFIVGSFGNGRSAEVLFERES
ncbi:MAG: DNA (cytosine-5-)-methyltransferase, partial [Methanotrichaceae archaeon]|nr:DNA (cytosine-5-)-methyltransferase [Methanotrichaceae archaeon]